MRSKARRPASRARAGCGPRRKSSTCGSAACMPPDERRGSPRGPRAGSPRRCGAPAGASRPSRAASSVGSPRSQPSEAITTTAPRVSPRRPQTSLKAASYSPMRVPPAQSGTARAARASARSGSRPAQVRRQPRQARAERERLDVAAAPRTAACRNITMARAYGSIEPETSTRKTSLRGTSLGSRQAALDRHAAGAHRLRAACAAGRTSPPGRGRSRRERRRGAARASRSISARSRPQLVGLIVGEVAVAQQLVGATTAPRSPARRSSSVGVAVAHLAPSAGRADAAARPSLARRQLDAGPSPCAARGARSQKRREGARRRPRCRRAARRSCSAARSRPRRGWRGRPRRAPRRASCSRPGPTSSPASRRIRPNVTSLRTTASPRGSARSSSAARRGLGHELAAGRVAHPLEILVVLQHRAERGVDHARRRARSWPSATSACVQSIVSATPGALARSSVAQPLDEGGRLGGQPLGHAGHAGAHDRDLALERRDARSSGRGSGA